MRNSRTDSGNYNTPAQILAPGEPVDDGQGGAPPVWDTVRSPMIRLSSSKGGGGARRAYQYGQLYPTASHWAEMRYASDVAIDASMLLVVDGRNYQVLGAIDQELEHVITVLPLVEYQAKGSI